MQFQSAYGRGIQFVREFKETLSFANSIESEFQTLSICLKRICNFTPIGIRTYKVMVRVQYLYELGRYLCYVML